ncbi:major facilitator superfamily domain-containing protein [Diaporthe sp. PMI_573]|nr:major facilitator superfamily domain-containing protein [Diaporthaceae sp. PMI_573]
MQDAALESKEVSDPDSAEKTNVKGFQFAIVMVAVCFIFAVVGLDSTIIAVALSAITSDFKTSSQIGWYLSIYRLMSGSCQPLFGKLYSLMPAKRLVLVSLLLFASGSLLAALAPTSPALIVGRAVTGLATAGVTSGAFAIIIALTPLSSRSKYSGIGAATEAAASLTAPLIGGALVDRLSWRWCFYIELPFLAVSFVLLTFFFKASHGGGVRGPSFKAVLRTLDILGTLILIPAFTCLILALQWGGNEYAWANWRVIMLLVLSVTLATAFVGWQIYLKERATIPGHILKRRNVVCGFLFACCNNGALSVVEYFMPTYFQIVHGISATSSGLLVLPSGIGLIVSVPLAGFLTSLLGYPNPFMILNGILVPVATGLLTTVKSRPGTWKLLVFQAMIGFGAGIGFQGPQIAVQTILSDTDAQIGIATIQLAQALGPAVFVVVSQTIVAKSLSTISKAENGQQDHSAFKTQSTFDGLDDESRSNFSNALGGAFTVPLALGFVVLVTSLCMRWQSVKRKA